LKAFFDELKRRNVIRVGGIYLAAGWVLMQAAALLEDALSMPAWFDTIIVSLILLGFPAVLLFAWLFEVTPEGLRRTPAVDAPEDQAFAASTRSRLDRTLIALIVVAVAVIVADRFLPRATAPAAATATEGAAASQATVPVSHRIAFFGFTANGSDAATAEVASTATDETYKTLNQIGLATVSRDQTQVVELGGQLARARELGALYALDGEVRNEGGVFRLSIRLDDAVNGTTIWNVTLTGDEADKVSMPFQATAAATGMADCFIHLRASLKREDEKTLNLVSRYCDAARRGDRSEHAERARELAASAPDSARVQSTFATFLHEVLLAAPMSDQPALRKEIDAALKLALDADPNDTQARTLGAVLAIEDGKPFAESESVLLEIVRQNPNDYAAHNWYGVILRSVGRYDDAVRYFRTANRLRPLDTILRGNLAGGLVITGQSLEGRNLFEETNAHLPTALMWEVWMGMTIAHNLSDPDNVLASAPASVSGDRLVCWRDIARAIASGDPRSGADRARTCNVRALYVLAALGDIGRHSSRRALGES
jgi:TolB-like protein